MAIVELKNIEKKYGEHIVLNNFSLKVNEGEMVALTGKSGCGKSTLLNIIGLLENIDSGEYLLDGEKINKLNSRQAMRALRSKINYLFQNFALIEEETVLANLEIATKYLTVSKKDKLAFISKSLEQVGLKGYEKRKIYELSGGEQQRVAIARCILKPCKIVLADEPTGSLDAENVDIVISLLKKLNESGKTVIIVTHDKYVASKCDRNVSL